MSATDTPGSHENVPERGWDDEPEPPFLVGVTDDFPGGNDDDLVDWAFEAGMRYQKWATGTKEN